MLVSYAYIVHSFREDTHLDLLTGTQLNNVRPPSLLSLSLSLEGN